MVPRNTTLTRHHPLCAVALLTRTYSNRRWDSRKRLVQYQVHSPSSIYLPASSSPVKDDSACSDSRKPGLEHH